MAGRVVHHGVTSLRLGEHEVSIVAGQIVLTQPELVGGVLGLKSWTLAARLAEFAFFDPDDYSVRAELDNGEVLKGRAILTNTNGRELTLRSNGDWTGVAGWS
jgi:hypothetical protein